MSFNPVPVFHNQIDLKLNITRIGIHYLAVTIQSVQMIFLFFRQKSSNNFAFFSIIFDINASIFQANISDIIFSIHNTCFFRNVYIYAGSLLKSCNGFWLCICFSPYMHCVVSAHLLGEVLY